MEGITFEQIALFIFENVVLNTFFVYSCLGLYCIITTKTLAFNDVKNSCKRLLFLIVIYQGIVIATRLITLIMHYT